MSTRERYIQDAGALALNGDPGFGVTEPRLHFLLQFLDLLQEELAEEAIILPAAYGHVRQLHQHLWRLALCRETCPRGGYQLRRLDAHGAIHHAPLTEGAIAESHLAPPLRVLL